MNVWLVVVFLNHKCMFCNLFNALLHLPSAFRPIPHPRVIMTLLVKDEETLLEHNLRFHHAMGVDGFIITDNNSADATPAIIERYRQMGWVLAVIHETGTDYRQKQWVDRMIDVARREFAADWIINADGDEFWYPPTGDFHTQLAHLRANVLRCEVIGMRPEEDIPFTEWRETAHETAEREALGLSPYGIFGPHSHKVMHRAQGYLQIAMGNHKVHMLPRWCQASDIRIYHYNHLGREAFVRKVVNGGEQLERNPSRHGGKHWRYFLELYRQDRLHEEYDRVVGTHLVEQLRRLRALRTDTTMSDWFAAHPET